MSFLKDQNITETTNPRFFLFWGGGEGTQGQPRPHRKKLFNGQQKPANQRAVEFQVKLFGT